MLTKVALIGRPVAESLSPRMQNAAFAALGLDWTYLAFDVGDPVAAVHALRTLGFAGANVTIPHKRAVVAACDEADGDAVNTLVFRDGRVLGFNTDREILAGIVATRACLIGAGGAAQALLGALPAETRVYSRSGTWPPDASGCDLIVNATPVREELLVAPEAGQVVVDLAYGPRGDGARRRGASRRLRGRRRTRGARPPGRRVAAPLDRARAAGRRDAARGLVVSAGCRFVSQAPASRTGRASSRSSPACRPA